MPCWHTQGKAPPTLFLEAQLKCWLTSAVPAIYALWTLNLPTTGCTHFFAPIRRRKDRFNAACARLLPLEYQARAQKYHAVSLALYHGSRTSRTTFLSSCVSGWTDSPHLHVPFSLGTPPHCQRSRSKARIEVDLVYSGLHNHMSHVTDVRGRPIGAFGSVVIPLKSSKMVSVATLICHIGLLL